MTFNMLLASSLQWLLMLALVQSAPPFQHKKTFALEDLVPPKYELHPIRVSGDWISENEFIYKNEGDLKKYNVDTEQEETFLGKDIHLNQSVVSYGIGGRFLLLGTDFQKIYRYSMLGKYSVYEMESRNVWPLAGGAPLQAVVWSPAKQPALAYVRDNNVFYLSDVANPLSAVPLTSSGVPGQIYNGVADWIYEEEVLNAAEAMWFSKEGSYLAVATFNDTLVESATYPVYGVPVAPEFQYPNLVSFKYPKSGRVNPTVSLNVFPLTNAWSEYKPIVHIPPPASLSSADHILGRVAWASDRHLVVLWLNRRQNASVLVSCDVVTAVCETKRTHEEPNGWIDITAALFDASGGRMVDVGPARTGEDRHSHALLLNLEDGTTQDLSPGNLTVKSIEGWHHKTDKVLYLMSPRSAPWEQQLWTSRKGAAECVSCSQPACKYVDTVAPSPGAVHAIVTCSSFNHTPVTFLYNAEKNVLKEWRNNNHLSQLLSGYNLPERRFFVAELPSGFPAYFKLLLPPNLDKNKKYPMLLNVYSGPGSSRISARYNMNFHTYLATNRSYIVCYVDVRGSGLMGLNAMHAVNRALGTVEIADTLEAIRYLTNKYSYIDASRVGVWGWSYGGYTSAMMLAHDTDKLLKCAASVAPVTSWLYYDTIYTERYMDVPGANPAGYERSDLLLQAPRLRDRRLFLVHGNADDNVHYQHSMLLSKLLQHADIEFEQMSYPDESHSLAHVSRHLYHTLDRYWAECFD